MNTSLESKVLRYGGKHSIDQLKNEINKASADEINEILKKILKRKDGSMFWNYLLLSFDCDSYELNEKRFSCVKCFLDCLLKLELSYKQSNDLTTRLCQDLPTFPNEQLVYILEHCIDGIRAGDPKCLSWKDLLPEILSVLSNSPQVDVNGISMSGSEYRNSTIRNLCAMRWPKEILTPIADMIKDLKLDTNEIILVLKKFSSYFHKLSPSALPALGYQLFSLCNTASEIIIPILGLDKYFHRFYYKKIFADLSSNSTDFESIDEFSDKELREAEETILHHLSYCTQYKISEIQMLHVLKNFSSLPDVVLTPFVLSAVLSMTLINRDPNTRLSSSVLLTFLRNVIKNNEDERISSNYSVWCRDTLQRKQVDLGEVFVVLIDQNKDGKDVITLGLVNLIFLLLRAKNSRILNNLAIEFLTKFIRKRFVFGQGVIKKITEWMVVEQDCPQYSECLTLLSVADTFTVSECVKAINFVMDFFVSIPGEQAMTMMLFIIPILKISTSVRDSFINVLRKALNSMDVKTKAMAVYGFCMILKQLNNSNSQRSQIGGSGFCTQHSISGFSLVSQVSLGSRSNPQRHFDMLTLEIIGLLRNCFTASLEIKLTLYEQLQRAVELNPKLVCHVLQFIDWHFRSYFEIKNVNDDEIYSEIRIDKLVCTISENDGIACEIVDSIGKLLMFITHCLVIYERQGSNYDIREIKRIICINVEKVLNKEPTFNEDFFHESNFKKEIKFLEIEWLEGLMAFTLLTSTQTNENVKSILPLYKQHQLCCEKLKTMDATKTHAKKQKSSNETKQTSKLERTKGHLFKNIDLFSTNVWDLDVVEKFMRLLHENIVPFAAPNSAYALRENVELVRFVLEVAIKKVEKIRTEPSYKQLQNSRRTLKFLTDITKIVYERCILQLLNIWTNYDARTAILATSCLKECLHTANVIYENKFADTFVKGFDLHVTNIGKEAPTVIQSTIDSFVVSEDVGQDDNTDKDTIIYLLLQCLEILYENNTYSSRITFDSYGWLLNFCKNNQVRTVEVGLVFKLLFTQRQKTHSGDFFNIIAKNLGNVLGFINENNKNDVSPKAEVVLKAVTIHSADSCLRYLLTTLRSQIDNVDYFIAKANNSFYKCYIVPEDDRELCFGNLRTLQRSICSHLAHISKTLEELTKVCIPLGNQMDNIIKLLTQHYTCLKNLSKHLINCSSYEKLSIQGSKFDTLLQVVGKPLPTNVYALITYLEANLLENEKKKSDPQTQKAKVLRETKLLPKLILSVENFNKHVILLAKKSNERLANYLHYGTVRDFRIKTSDLKEALVRTLANSSQIYSDDEIEREMEGNGGAEIEILNRDTINSSNGGSDQNKEKGKNGKQKVKNNNKGMKNSDGIVESGVLYNESNKESATQLLENIANINKRAQKRCSTDTSDVQTETKKRRSRVS